MLEKTFESFTNNVLCRRDTNQHTAKGIWKELKNHIPENKRREFETEWNHYLLGELNTDEFGSYIKELKEHLGHDY